MKLLSYKTKLKKLLKPAVSPKFIYGHETPNNHRLTATLAKAPPGAPT